MSFLVKAYFFPFFFLNRQNIGEAGEYEIQSVSLAAPTFQNKKYRCSM